MFTLVGLFSANCPLLIYIKKTVRAVQFLAQTFTSRANTLLLNAPLWLELNPSVRYISTFCDEFSVRFLFLNQLSTSTSYFEKYYKRENTFFYNIFISFLLL